MRGLVAALNANLEFAVAQSRFQGRVLHAALVRSGRQAGTPGVLLEVIHVPGLCRGWTAVPLWRPRTHSLHACMYV